MSRRPVQDVRIWEIQDRSSHAGERKPFVVRRVVDGRETSRDGSFATWGEADRYRARLITARQDGERFDPRTGEPESWAPAGADTQLHDWARQWLAENWDEWQPYTRIKELDGLVRFIPAVIDPRASEPPKKLRAYMRQTFPPAGQAMIDPVGECERWLIRWVLTLGELEAQNLAKAELKLGLKDDGTPAASETARRHRRSAKTCVRRAVELKMIPVDPWPPTPRGRSRRKVNRDNKAVDVKRLHGPATVVRVIDNLASHRPESERWQVMTAVVYYAGLRPGEVKYLRPNDLYLPEEGWGLIIVDETDDGEDNAADPKSGGRRPVPIPPRLVRLLRDWLAKHDFGPDGLIFRTRNGKAPAQTNWSRALQRAHRLTGVHHIEVYAYRHAALTLWIREGMPLAEASRRAGNSIKVLVETYIDAMEGDEELGNVCIERGLAGTREQILLPKEKTA